MRVVISQSMLFPWVGMLEQVRLADVFVHYDDVQFSKGSFVNRVQVKTPDGFKWMTIPLHELRLGQRINEVQPLPIERWRDTHLRLLERSFKDAPHVRDAMELAEAVYGQHPENLAALTRASMLSLCNYFGLMESTRFVDINTLDATGSSSDRVLSAVRQLGGSTYITGHGAARYLDHPLFEQHGIEVVYMDYQRRAYPQAHGAFNPYVTGLDLVAHCGRQGYQQLCSGTVSWKEFTREPH